jgi:hypothetical protein
VITAYVLLKANLAVDFTSGIIMMYIRVDQIMIGSVGNKGVGLSVSTRFTELWYFLPHSLPIYSFFFSKLVEKILR